MRISPIAVLALLLSAAYAGCSGIAPAPVLPSARAGDRQGSVESRADTTTASPDASGGKLFVSNFYKARIEIYPSHVANAAPIGAISVAPANPYNLAIDSHGKLYVQGNNNTIQEYPPGKTSPSKTLTEPPAGPGGLGTGICVTVGDDGTVYAADYYGSQLYEFAHGSTTPTTTIAVPSPFGLVLDAANDLYVGYSPVQNGTARVMRFRPGQKTGKDLGIVSQLGGGIDIDTSGNLLVGDQGTQKIFIYKPGAKSPFRTIDVAPAYPYQFAIDRTGAHLYLVSGSPAKVYVYDYASGKLLWLDDKGQQSNGYAMGVAVQPEAAH